MYSWTDIFHTTVYAVTAMVSATVLGYYLMQSILPSAENIDILLYEQHILNQPHKSKKLR